MPSHSIVLIARLHVDLEMNRCYNKKCRRTVLLSDCHLGDTEVSGLSAYTPLFTGPAQGLSRVQRST